MSEELRTTCPFCGLHCTDLRLTVDGGRLAQFDPPCEKGQAGYADVFSSLSALEAESSQKASLRKARLLLQSARRVLVVLSIDLDREAVESAIQFSEKFSAILTCEEDYTGSIFALAMKTAGFLTGTLGEMRNLDQVVLCGVEPWWSHPRLSEIIRNDLATQAIRLDYPDPLEAIRWLRLGVHEAGEELPNMFAETANRIRQASSGVVFFGPEWLKGSLPLTTELLLWLRDLNRTGCWYAHYLSPATNNTSVVETLLSATGFPPNLRFETDGVENSPRRWQAERLIQSEWPDFCLLIGQPKHFSRQTLARLKKIRAVLLAPQPPSWKPCAWLPVAQAGIDAPGQVLRLDGVPVTLHPIIPGRRPRVDAILADLASEGPRV